jgi:hypothetical protein
LLPIFMITEKGEPLSQEDIKKMTYEILIRFEEEAKEHEKRLESHKFSETSVYARRRYYYQLYRRMSHAIIREVGEFIIMPYTVEPKTTIAQFLSEIDNAYGLGYRDNMLPDLNEFMTWYCDSGLIQKEVADERAKRNNPLNFQPQ